MDVIFQEAGIMETRIAKQPKEITCPMSISRIRANRMFKIQRHGWCLLPLFYSHTIHHCVEVHDFNDSPLFATAKDEPLARVDINPVTWWRWFHVDYESGSNVTFTVLPKHIVNGVIWDRNLTIIDHSIQRTSNSYCVSAISLNSR